MFLFSSFPQFLGNKQRTINCQNPKHSREKNKKIKKSDKEKLYPISNFTEQNQTQIPLHTTAETKNKAHVPSTRNDNKKIHSKQYNTLEFENLPPFSFLGNQTQKLDIFEHRERERERELPVVRALTMPARRPLKSLKTSSTVRGLYCAPPPSIGSLSLSLPVTVLVTKYETPSQNN
jgi:hypothetical protein